MASAQLTLLNSMAGDEFAAALDRHVAWGLLVAQSGKRAEWRERCGYLRSAVPGIEA